MANELPDKHQTYLTVDLREFQFFFFPLSSAVRGNQPIGIQIYLSICMSAYI